MVNRKGILKGFTTQDLFNLMNDGIYDDSTSGRHEVIKNFRPPTLKREESKDKPEDAVVNVIIWGGWKYYKWAYVSLISAFTHSDIGKFKVRVIIRDERDSLYKVESARAIFEPLGVEVLVTGFLDRNSIILEQEERFQMAFNIDTFLIGKKYPIFTNLYNLLKNDPGFYSSSNNDLLDEKDRDKVIDSQFLSGKIFKFWTEDMGFNESDFRELVESEDNKWSRDTLYGLDRNLFNNERWRKVDFDSEKFGIFGREHMIKIYLWSEGIRIGFIKDLFGIEVPVLESHKEILDNYLKGKQEFCIFHPYILSGTSPITIGRGIPPESLLSLLVEIFMNADSEMDLCYSPILV